MSRTHLHIALACASGLALGSASAAEPLAIAGATVHSLGEAGTLDRATVLIRDGKIAALGPKLAVSDDTHRIEGKGKVVTPGLFDALSDLGTEEVELVAGTVDSAAESAHLGAAFDITGAMSGTTCTASTQSWTRGCASTSKKNFRKSNYPSRR